MSHIPVLLNPILEALLPPERTVSRVIDGTLGAGGHSKALLENGAEMLLGLDLDPNALALAQQTLAPFGDRARVVHSSYVDMKAAAAAQGWHKVDAILLDLGVSSMQLDTPERGFAFMYDAALDMRFDPDGMNPPAAEIVNLWNEAELSEIFFRYGEEKFSRRIAQAIIKQRPLETTRQLAEIVAKAVPPDRSKRKKDAPRMHPATRIFQALRIAVNDELNSLEQVLPRAIDLLNPGGRLAVISFHSLEDRIVKQVFRDASEEIISPPGMVLEEKRAIVRLVTRKPIVADEGEIAHNPRSRSAKLRVVEKI